MAEKRPIVFDTSGANPQFQSLEATDTIALSALPMITSEKVASVSASALPGGIGVRPRNVIRDAGATTITIPDGVPRVRVDIIGAGGNFANGNPGGDGGLLIAWIDIGTDKRLIANVGRAPGITSVRSGITTLQVGAGGDGTASGAGSDGSGIGNTFQLAYTGLGIYAGLVEEYGRGAQDAGSPNGSDGAILVWY